MSIKSKRWYENQIKALENATNKIHLRNERILEIYRNDITGGFKAIESDKELNKKLINQLGLLKEEYYLYYR